jgi:hypothetical protein
MMAWTADEVAPTCHVSCEMRGDERGGEKRRSEEIRGDQRRSEERRGDRRRSERRSEEMREEIGGEIAPTSWRRQPKPRAARSRTRSSSCTPRSVSAFEKIVVRSC